LWTIVDFEETIDSKAKDKSTNILTDIDYYLNIATLKRKSEPSKMENGAQSLRPSNDQRNLCLMLDMLPKYINNDSDIMQSKILFPILFFAKNLPTITYYVEIIYKDCNKNPGADNCLVKTYTEKEGKSLIGE